MRPIYAIPEYLVSKYLPEKFFDLLTKIDPLDICSLPCNDITVSDLAKLHGLSNFDTTLPIDWVRDFQAKTGTSPVGHFVYSYDINIFGEPLPITRTGKILLSVYKHIEKQKDDNKYKTDC